MTGVVGHRGNIGSLELNKDWQTQPGIQKMEEKWL